MPVSSGIVTPLRARRGDRATRWRRRRVLIDDGLHVTLDFLGEDTLDEAQAEATVSAVPRAARGAQPCRPRPQRRGEREALRDRPGAARRRPQAGDRERPADLPCRPQHRHHGHPRHGGPHHHRRHARDAARAAQGLPGDGSGAAGLPAPHRAGLPRARPRGQPGAAVQGRLQRARGGRLPGPARRRQVLRALPEGADGRRGLPDGRHPRPAAGQDRLGARHPQRPDARHLRVPDALRHPHRGAEAPRRRPARRCASTCRTARSGTAT